MPDIKRNQPIFRVYATESDAQDSMRVNRAFLATTTKHRSEDDDPNDNEDSLSLEALYDLPLESGSSRLHDTDGQAGDEDEMADLMAVDTKSARELGVNLDSVDNDESALD